MKIVRIIARLNVGGPAIHVILLTHEFRKRGHESLLVVGPVPETEGNMEYYASKWNVLLVRVPELIRPLSLKNDWVAFWKIFRLLRRERPDIVHTHTAKAGTLGRVAAILAGTPVILHTFHGNIFDGYFSPARTRLFLFIERLLARFTDRIISISKSQSDELINKHKIAQPDKFEIVRLGIDLDEFREVEGDNRCHSEDRENRPLVIGWVGRLTEIKDPLFFVDLAAVMKSSGTPAKFVMVGDGHLRQAIEAKISEYSLQGDFTLSGWQQEMAEVYSRIDLMVLTSLNEGTPVTMIEAMATGRPFVAFNVGGLLDLMVGPAQRYEGFEVYDNGILVRPRDTATFVKAVGLLVQDPERRIRMGQAGKVFALQNFSKERLAQDTEALYRKLAVTHAGGSAETHFKRLN
jgi:glycosyltransferase involved in cell wall biosynthesis